MDDLRDVIAEVDLSTEVTDGLDGGRAQFVGSVRPLETFHDDRQNQVHVFFHACSENVERFDHSQEILFPAIRELGSRDVAFERPQDLLKEFWQERLELAFHRNGYRFHQRSDREL